MLVSVVLHGFSPMLLIRAPKETPAPAPASMNTVVVTAVPDNRRSGPITLDEYQQLKGSGSVVLVDSRSARTFAETDAVPGSVRVHPDRAVAEARRLELPVDTTLVVFCA